jgi:hypothetical protein
VMSPDEAKRLLAMAGSLKVQVLLALGYGAGLRAGEVVRLRVGDIDSTPWKAKMIGLSAVNSASNSKSERPCGCSLEGCSFIRSTTLMTLTLQNQEPHSSAWRTRAKRSGSTGLWALKLPGSLA